MNLNCKNQSYHRIHGNDKASSNKIMEMMKDIEKLKTEISPQSITSRVNKSSKYDHEIPVKLRKVIHCANLMQKNAFEQRIDEKLPFFFTQLNKIKMITEKLLKNFNDKENIKLDHNIPKEQKKKSLNKDLEPLMRKDYNKSNYEEMKSLKSKYEEILKENQMLLCKNKELVNANIILNKENTTLKQSIEQIGRAHV